MIVELNGHPDTLQVADLRVSEGERRKGAENNAAKEMRA